MPELPTLSLAWQLTSDPPEKLSTVSQIGTLNLTENETAWVVRPLRLTMRSFPLGRFSNGDQPLAGSHGGFSIRTHPGRPETERLRPALRTAEQKGAEVGRCSGRHKKGTATITPEQAGGLEH
ncbi:hypothetical protein [Streptosporangium sp. 'caverna']|uniref:hypothetical protein n=1 Tax=Streptosporangium sp. 'caverna' TaxID=2202249 RepID=UPI0013A6EC21|nr:hypothetical protein [Streptosporangium sp. 'caverna']